MDLNTALDFLFSKELYSAGQWDNAAISLLGASSGKVQFPFLF